MKELVRCKHVCVCVFECGMSWDKNRKYDVPGRYNNDAGVPDRNASELFSSILHTI